MRTVTKIENLVTEPSNVYSNMGELLGGLHDAKARNLTISCLSRLTILSTNESSLNKLLWAFFIILLWAY